MSGNATTATNLSCNGVTILEDSGAYAENISSILTIIICTVGIALNALNLVIATRRPSKGSLHVYLITLSIVDGLYLICVLPSRAFRCGNGCQTRPTFSAQIYEKFVYLPIANTLVVIDAYVTCIWAIHRLTYIHKPRIITNHSSIPVKAIALATIFSAAVHVPYFLKWEVNGNHLERTQFTLSNSDLYYTTFLMVVTRALPILTLFITNILLLSNIKQALRRRKQLTFQPSAQIRYSKQQTKLTVLLVGVICLMIIGNTPVVFAHPPISQILFDLNEECLEFSRGYREFRAVANLLEQISFSLNFVVYYFMNKNFKDFTHKALQCKCVSKNAVSDSELT